jgi:hypothetical protein
LRYRMTVCRTSKKHLSLSADWPGEKVLLDLTHRAYGLFVWASTASTFIDGHNPSKRLAIILDSKSTSAESSLDALYKTALESAGDWNDPDFVEEFRSILGIVLAAKDPLSTTAIDKLICTSENQPSSHTISCLGCVMDQSPTVRVLHPSFADFLSTSTRCERRIWFIDQTMHNRRLLMLCLDHLHQTLKRNIKEMTLSSGFIDGSLSEETSYACTFWIEHVCAVTEDTGPLAKHLDTFLHIHLLHWLECMSILEGSRMAIKLLYCLLEWIKASIIIVNDKETAYL